MNQGAHSAAGERPVRLFVGVDLTDGVRETVAAYADAAFGGRIPGRPVVARNWHLTLRFLGDIDAARRERIERELAAIDAAAFTLSLGGLGAFPRPARAIVLWLGVAAGSDALRALAAQVEGAAVRAGYAPEPKPYSPHLTLSRLQPPADLRAALAHAPPLERASLPVDRFVLFRSHLGGGPPRYERLRDFALR